MSQRKVAFTEKEFYHLYNRGNSKQKIFHNAKDYDRFIALLYLANGVNNFKIDNIGKKEIYEFERGQQLVSIGAYCLMPNHFHLVITPTPDGSVSKFMQKLTTGYSMFINKKYARTGSLFEGRFKSEHAGKDRYLKYLFSYCHLNPVKLKDKNWKTNGIKDKTAMLEFLKNYSYSSYQDYIGIERSENLILNKGAFPDYFSDKEIFIKEMFDWLSYKDDRPDLSES